MPSENHGTPFIPFAMPRAAVTPVTEWRSTWITSGIQTLRERGLHDRYVANLAPEHRDSIPLTVAGVWVPVATARAHYVACDALCLAPAQIREIGAAVGDRAQGSIMRTAVALAKGVGVDGWTMFGHARRVWERGIRGGAIAVFRAGPKEAVIEALGCELFDVPYFRVSFASLTLGILQLVTSRAYLRELPGRHPGTFVTRYQWV